MKRTTVLLPDDVAKLLRLEAERRGVTPSLLIREAVATYVAGPPTERRVLKFANIVGPGEAPDDGFDASRLDKYLAEHWARDIEEDAFGGQGKVAYARAKCVGYRIGKRGCRAVKRYFADSLGSERSC